MPHKNNKKPTERQAVSLSASTGVPAETVGNCSRLVDAFDRFCTENTQFESSTACECVHADIIQAPNINQAALVPLRHKIFSFERALLWGFFLMLAVPKLLDKSNPLYTFDIEEYLTELVTIYDMAVNSQVWDLLEDEDTDEDDE